MNNPAIEQALAELEDSIQQIKSANQNVNTLSDKSEQLILVMTKVINTLNTISSNVNIDKEALAKVLKENGQYLKNGLTKVIEESESQYAELDKALQKHETNFNKSLEKTVKGAELRMNNVTSSFADSSKEIQQQISVSINTLSNEVNNTTKAISDFRLSVQVLNEQVKATDFTAEFKVLNDSFKKKQNLLFIFQIITIIGLIAIALLK